MKKLTRVLLVLIMLLGLCVGVSAVVEPTDPTTWPVLVLDEPAELEWDSEAGDYMGHIGIYYTGYYRFVPVESGQYVFDVLNPNNVQCFSQIIIIPFNGEEAFTGIRRVVVYLKEGNDYAVGAWDVTIGQPGNVFQLVVQKYTPDPAPPWWASLPTFLQFLLRWFAFGWLWMV